MHALEWFRSQEVPPNYKTHGPDNGQWKKKKSIFQQIIGKVCICTQQKKKKKEKKYVLESGL